MMREKRHSVPEPVIYDSIEYPFTVGVIGDTHVQTRRGGLFPGIAEAMASYEPSVILHTGDVVLDGAMDPLREVAPLYIVRGNRDLPNWRRYPSRMWFHIGRFRLLLFHGQGNLWQYIRIKAYFTVTAEPKKEKLSAFPHEADEADICIFGHSHIAMVVCGEKLLINPGAAYLSEGEKASHHPSFAVLKFTSPERVFSRVIRNDFGEWHEICNKEYGYLERGAVGPDREK